MGRPWRNNGLTASGCLLLALSLLILPLRWVLAWLLAAAVHEGCHLAAVWLCGGSLDAVRLDAQGASMVAIDLTTAQELLCVLAGPVGTVVVLLPLIRLLPATAVCGLCQSAYNLLPFEALDGGRALSTALELLFPRKIANRISRAIHWICVTAVLLLGVYSAIWLKLGMMPLILSIWLAIKGNSGKIPCNRWHQAVQ